MTINDDQTVAAVAAPETSKEVKEKLLKINTYKILKINKMYSLTADLSIDRTLKLSNEDFNAEKILLFFKTIIIINCILNLINNLLLIKLIHLFSYIINYD
tara:strand:- start:2545 stop:2847 length:303 start_codon:yes stop_codon:yes gene_type:complete